MQMVHRFMAVLLLTAAIAAPASIAAAAGQQARVQVRVYDKNHKDYHNWDDHENQSWGLYLSQNHKKSHEFAKSNRKEQADYWNWRHSHPDNDRRDNDRR